MDRRYTKEPCECGDPFCAGCREPDPDTGEMDEEEEERAVREIKKFVRWEEERTGGGR